MSKALTELEASEDKELMQPLESRLTDLKARLHGTRPIGQQVDGLRGVISRCQKRLAEADVAKAEAEATNYQRDRGHGELSNPNSQNSNHSSLHPRGSQWDAGMGGEYSVINRQTRVGKQYDRQRGCRSILS